MQQQLSTQDPAGVIKRLRSTIVEKEREIAALSEQVGQLEGDLHSRDLAVLRLEAAVKRAEIGRGSAEAKEAAQKAASDEQSARIKELEVMLSTSEGRVQEVESAARDLMKTVHHQQHTTTGPSTPRKETKEASTRTPPVRKVPTVASPTQTTRPQTNDAHTLTEAQQQHHGGGVSSHDWATSASVVLRYYEGVIANLLDEGRAWTAVTLAFLRLKERQQIEGIQQVGREERARYDQRIAVLRLEPPSLRHVREPSTGGAELLKQMAEYESEKAELHSQLVLADNTIHSIKDALLETSAARDDARREAADLKQEILRLSAVIAESCTTAGRGGGMQEAEHSSVYIEGLVRERDDCRRAIRELQGEVRRLRTTNRRVDREAVLSLDDDIHIVRALIDNQRVSRPHSPAAPLKRGTTTTSKPNAAPNSQRSPQFPTVRTAPPRSRAIPATGSSSLSQDMSAATEALRAALQQRIDDLQSPDRERRARVVREYTNWVRPDELLVANNPATAAATRR